MDRIEPDAKQPMTFTEAAKLDPDTQAGEVDAGKWVPVTKSTWRHGEIVVNVCIVLRQYAKTSPGWSVSAGDPGVKVRKDPDTLRGPDVAMVRSDRKPAGRGSDGWLDGSPDLAVEVLGDAQPVAEIMRKALEFLSSGGRLVWILDPDAAQVMVVTPPNQVRVVGAGAALDGGDVLPGFSCPVADLFG